MSEFFAHSGVQNEFPTWQKLAEHLGNVAGRASARADRLGLPQAALLAGLYHDLGKYDPAFQRKLRGEANRVDHSTAGAAILLEKMRGQDAIPAQMIAYAILGHHAGLPDFDTPDLSSLQRRVDNHKVTLDPSWRGQVPEPVADLQGELLALIGKAAKKDRLGFDISVATRMLFSCLVDADFRDTEAFYGALEGVQKHRDWPDLAEVLPGMSDAFNRHMARLAGSSGVNQLRSDILSHVRGKAAMSPGLFTLTVPTGGGKTLASLGFALDHARMHGHQRIIYAVPFTSIIDQTAAIFREILGAGNVLEHHSAIEVLIFTQK